MLSSTERARPRVVVIGGGFAGLQAVRKLRGAAVDVTLVDRQNFHLFQPLVYQVATGALSAAEVRVVRAARDDEGVVAEARARLAVGQLVEHDLPAVEVEADHVGEEHARVPLAAKDPAQRHRHLGG